MNDIGYRRSLETDGRFCCVGNPYGPYGFDGRDDAPYNHAPWCATRQRPTPSTADVESAAQRHVTDRWFRILRFAGEDEESHLGFALQRALLRPTSADAARRCTWECDLHAKFKDGDIGWPGDPNRHPHLFDGGIMLHPLPRGGRTDG